MNLCNSGTTHSIAVTPRALVSIFVEHLEEPDGEENEQREKREEGKKVLPASQKEERRLLLGGINIRTSCGSWKIHLTWFLNRHWNKKIFNCMEYYSATWRNKTKSAVVRWMNLEFCHTQWSKSEREKQVPYIKAYMWNLERWYRWTYVQGRNRGADIENGCVDPGVVEGESRANWEISIDIYTYTTICKIDKEWEPAV